MQVIPQLYLRGGKVVALEGTTTPLYNEDIVVMCRSLKEAGVEAIYVVDMNVARVGQSQNFQILRRLKKETGLFIYEGGTFLSTNSVEQAFQGGADVVMLGTSAYQEPALVKEVTGRFAGKIGVNIDLRGGRVTIPGWTVVANKTALDYGERFAEQGVKYIFYSDVDNQGNVGPDNYKRLLEFCKQMSFSVVSSSEVKSAQDVE